MGTIFEKLDRVSDTKKSMYNVLVELGASIDEDTPFKKYPELMAEMSGGSDISIPGAITIITKGATNTIIGKAEVIE